MKFSSQTVPWAVSAVLAVAVVWLVLKLREENERAHLLAVCAWSQLLTAKDVCNESSKLREGGTTELPDDAILNAFRKSLALQADIIVELQGVRREAAEEFKSKIILKDSPPPLPPPVELPRRKVVLPP